MIGKLAWQELKRNIRFDTLIFLLLIVVYAVIVSMGAVVEYRFRDYMVFAEEMQQKGMILGVSVGSTPESYLIRRKEELLSYLRQTTDVEGMYWVMPMRWQYREMVAYSYDDAFLEKYMPELEEGQWLTEVDPEDTTLKAVVSYNDSDISVGDVLTITNSAMEDKEITVEIIGKLAEDAKVIGYNQFEERKGGCGDFLLAPWDLDKAWEQANKADSVVVGETAYRVPILFFANEQLNHHPYFDPSAPGADGTGFQRVMNGLVFVLYEKDITEENIEHNLSYGLSNVFSPFQMDLQEYNKAALDYILSGMKSFLAVIICIFCLIIVASVSIEMLTAKKQLRNYAIYYITGLQWKHIYRIHLLHMLYLSGGAMLITWIGFWIGNGDVVHWNLLSAGICIFMLALNVFLSVLAPKLLIGRTQPVALFHEN